MEREDGLPHKLSVEERKKLTMTGATEVLHFDEEMARLATSRGLVTIHGQELKLKCLSLEGGLVSVTGEIGAVIYEQPSQRRGIGRWLG